MVFFIFPTDLSSTATFSVIARRIQAALAGRYTIDFRKYQFGESVGISDGEPFVWRDHEVETVDLFWRSGDRSGEIEIWCDSISSAFVGTLDDFPRESLTSEERTAILRANLHWRFAVREIDAKSVEVAVRAGTAVALSFSGLILVETEGAQFECLSPQQFLLRSKFSDAQIGN